MEKPDFLKSGDVARLIPVISDSRKEQRAASALLSVFSAVPKFADAVLSAFGANITKTTQIDTFTEVVIHNDKLPPKDRPDGLIVLRKGQKIWTALVEAKIGKSTIQKEQIERYLQLARDQNIDAVISVSNEFVARPTHHPIAIAKPLLRKVDWFHTSWTSILTEAILLHENRLLDDPEQAFLIREFVRFFSHESAGIEGFTQMPSSWGETVKTLKDGGTLKKSSDDVLDVVAGWHQETRELALQLTQYVSRKVDLKLPRRHIDDHEARLKDEIETLCSDGVLTADLVVPDAASDMTVTADLKSRAIRIGMTLLAPKDKKTTKARINWLLRQLQKSDPKDVVIRIKWASKASDTDIPLSTLQQDIEHPEINTSNVVPRAFEIVYSTDQAGRFSGRRTFIEELEKACPTFYSNIGQHLKSWQPKPPKPKKRVGTKTEDAAQTIPNPSTGGNDHTALLEVPAFLRRMEEGSEPSQRSATSSAPSKPERVSRFPAFWNNTP